MYAEKCGLSGITSNNSNGVTHILKLQIAEARLGNA